MYEKSSNIKGQADFSNLCLSKIISIYTSPSRYPYIQQRQISGDQGRGFAVVAAEVRELANQSSASAKEIRRVVADIFAETETVSKRIDEDFSRMRSGSDEIAVLRSELENATGLMNDFLSKVRELPVLMSEIAQAMENVSAASVETKSAVSGIMETVENITGMVRDMVKLAGRFAVE